MSDPEARLGAMSERERVPEPAGRGPGETERGGEWSPRTDGVLPEDLDVDAEVDRRFAQPGVGLRVAVV
jgi:hypothetical protein